MTTRTGKRIHAVEEYPVEETEVVLRSERKTRSQKHKENVEMSVKKHYVRYPGDDVASTSNGVADEKARRKTRRNTLKELNADAPMSSNTCLVSDSNARKTRKGKRMLGSNGAADTENNENEEEPKTKSVKDKKKSKKKKSQKKKPMEEVNGDLDNEVVVKKKGGKKKKKSNSMQFLVQDLPQVATNVLNRSHLSVESFHSAAGSPVSNGLIRNDYKNLNTTFDKDSKSPLMKRPSDKLNTTFDRNNDEECLESDDKISSTVKDSDLNYTFNKTDDNHIVLNTTVEKETKKGRKSSIKKSAFENIKDDESSQNLTFDIELSNLRGSKASSDADLSVEKEACRRKSSIKNTTFDKTEDFIKISQANSNASFDTEEIDPQNSTFDKELSKIKKSSLIEKASTEVPTSVEKETRKRRKSSIKNSTYDKTEDIFEISDTALNATFDKEETGQKDSTFDKQVCRKRGSIQIKTDSTDAAMSLNSTFDRSSKGKVSKTKSFDTTFDKDSNIQLNTTFEKSNQEVSKKSLNDSKKSSISSSEATINVTDDLSANSSRISITSDECTTPNILNFTPVLVESSIDESRMSEDSKKTPEKPASVPLTPLKREGTFTKEGPDSMMSPRHKVSTEKTPVKRHSLQSPGHTPFPFSKSFQKESVFNVTRSIEKSLRRSSLADVGPRHTRVMFCSPVNNPAVASQMKGRVIKSNLKGSNKSFVFDDSVSESRRTGRKRSHTHSEAESRAKRKRLADDLQHSVDRLSRPRTLSAAAKLTEPGTPPRKPTTPSKAPEGRVTRTKLPNFAALHQKQFAKMESLDECQQRKAKRARQLLTPTGSLAVVERTSPKDPSPTQPTKGPATASTKPHTPSKPKLTLASLNPGYTRFGFKINIDVNPFSVTAKKPDVKAKENRAIPRKTTCLALPSLSGSTVNRRDVAKQAVMREKSFTERRDVGRRENRTVIKGVRTNRRFELQMKLRNINA